MSKQTVWYQLFTRDCVSMGYPDAVFLEPNSLIVQFKDAVKLKNPDLNDIPARKLLVYLNKNNFKQGMDAIKSSVTVSGYGLTEDDALYVTFVEQG